MVLAPNFWTGSTFTVSAPVEPNNGLCGTRNGRSGRPCVPLMNSYSCRDRGLTLRQLPLPSLTLSPYAPQLTTLLSPGCTSLSRQTISFTGTQCYSARYGSHTDSSRASRDERGVTVGFITLPDSDWAAQPSVRSSPASLLREHHGHCIRTEPDSHQGNHHWCLRIHAR